MVIVFMVRHCNTKIEGVKLLIQFQYVIIQNISGRKGLGMLLGHIEAFFKQDITQ